MKVILNKDVRNLGKKYDVVEVQNGYANNYLLPNSLAIIFTEKAYSESQKNKSKERHKTLVKSKEFAFKKEFFLFVQNIQIIEECLFQFCKQFIDSPADIYVLEHKNIFQLMEESKKQCALLDGNYIEVFDCLESMLIELRRNDIIHELTLKYYDKYIWEEPAVKESNLRKFYNNIHFYKEKSSKYVKDLEELGLTRKLYFGKKRTIQPSNHTQIINKHTKLADHTISFCERKKIDPLKYINFKVVNLYFTLMTVFNFIHLNIRDLMYVINKKHHVWSDSELHCILKRDDFGTCLNKLKIKAESFPGLYSNLYQPTRFFDKLHEINNDRVYWVHYFHIDYLHKNNCFVNDENSSLESKLKVYKRLMASIDLAGEYDKVLVSLGDKMCKE